MWRRHLVWGLCCCQPPRLAQRCFQVHCSWILDSAGGFCKICKICRIRLTARSEWCPELALHLLSRASLSLTLQPLRLPSFPCFSDGMCSCCCLLFPFAVFAFQHGDFGIAAELRCQGNGLCCLTAYTWDLESLSICILSSPLFFHLSLRFSLVLQRLAEPPVLLFLLLSSAFRSQKYSHIHNETHTVGNKICVLRFYHSLPFPPPHFTFSVVVTLRSLSIPMWGFKCGFAGYQSPSSPQAYITVSSLLWNTTALLTGLRLKFSSLDLKCNNIDLNMKLNSSDWCQSRYHADVTAVFREK